jgi:hypothetical protein
MNIKTMRVYESDLDRARFLAAVRHELPQDVLRAALDEFVSNHRDEMTAQFDRVRVAVLSDNRDGLRAAFLAKVPAQVDADMRHLERLLEEA